jgi:hypothetical protein
MVSKGRRMNLEKCGTQKIAPTKSSGSRDGRSLGTQATAPALKLKATESSLSLSNGGMRMLPFKPKLIKKMEKEFDAFIALYRKRTFEKIGAYPYDSEES